ncbi:fatty acyl-AMP ligase [Micromonospora sp. NPDC048843]|uniref:fatty acyl-AMP ligase n=1 Tax=Micromonospora sp. NPDC048843 TaxID=3155389 RepID=UPI0033C9FEB7
MTVDLTSATSVTEVIRWHVARHPERLAVAQVTDPDEPDGIRWWSYGRLDEQARRVAAWLQERGARGDRVLLFYPSGHDFVAAFLGCLYAGMVALPAPIPGAYRHEQRRARAIAVNSGASIVCTDSESRDAVAGWAADAMTGVEVTATDTIDADPDRCRIHPADRDTLALLQYTSGSTADPKGVMIAHGNLLVNAEAVRTGLGLDAGTRFGGWIPNYHDMGLMGLITPPLLYGGSTALMRPATFLKRPHLWLRMVHQLDIQLSAAPSFAYDLCVRRVRDEHLNGVDLSGWRYAINGSEPVVASVLDAFRERFAGVGFRPETMLPCFGMAEATVFVSGTARRATRVDRVDADRLAAHRFEIASGTRGRDLVSCGAVHDLDVRIVDPDSGTVLGANEVGEIWLRGGSVSHGYWQEPAATAATFGHRTAGGEEGFLRTGDLGVLHDGELYVTGRIKETMVIRGRNLYPQDIEHELRLQHRELDSAVGAVFTVPSGPAGDEVLVVTHEVKGRLDPGALAELARNMRQTVAREFGIRAGGVALLRRGSVRRTTSGKIQRSAMRDLYLQRELGALHVDQDEHLVRSGDAR